MRRMSILALLALAAVAEGCEADLSYPVPGLPGSCKETQRACYTHPRDGREILLRCNAGEVKATVWVVDRVCEEGELCDSGACSPVG
jgi:hypothetical protein